MAHGRFTYNHNLLSIFASLGRFSLDGFWDCDCTRAQSIRSYDPSLPDRVENVTGGVKIGAGFA